jgi:tRNA pseudouridine55 synthase
VREPSGILLVDKPEGPTSRQVAETVGSLLRQGRSRSRRGERRFRVGHAGTLDPLATGLLVILVGRGTRLAPFLQGLDKRYLATVRLGAETDSHDRQGEVVRTAAVPARPDGLESALAMLRGTVQQVPPIISSIKRGGQSLHRLARAGLEVAAPAARAVQIDELQATAVRWALPAAPEPAGLTAPDGLLYEIDLDIACGSGTYVRAIARDLGEALGTLGYVQALRRVAVGPFRIEQAVRLDDLVAAAAPAVWLQPLADALPHLPAHVLDADRAARVRQGGQPEPGWLPLPVPAQFRLLDPDGGLVAVGRREPQSGQPLAVVVFPLEPTAPMEVDPCG